MKNRLILFIILLSVFVLSMNSNLKDNLSETTQNETIILHIEMRSWFFTIYDNNWNLIMNHTSIDNILTLWSNKTTDYIFNITNPDDGPNAYTHSMKFGIKENFYFATPPIDIGNSYVTDPVGFNLGYFTVLCATSCGAGHDLMKFKINIIEKPEPNTTVTSTSGSYIYIFYNSTEISYIIISKNETQIIIYEKTVTKTINNTSTKFIDKSTTVTQKLSSMEFILLILSLMSMSILMKIRRNH